MISWMSMLPALRCPFCGGPFATDSRSTWEYGILRCFCGRYPVVAGIPVLSKDVVRRSGEPVESIVALIETGRGREALLSLLRPPAPASPTLAPRWVRALPSVKGVRRLKTQAHSRAVRRLRAEARAILSKPASEISALEALRVYFYGEPAAFDYFAYRLGQPRHLAALAFTTILGEPRKPFLELACGFGHITRTLARRAGHHGAIGMDRNFFSLYVAKHWIAPDAQYICYDVEGALPFPDEFFAAAFCVDGIHYVQNKAAVVGELNRVVDDRAVTIFAASRNALFEYPFAGSPLAPAGYEALVATLPHRIVGDTDVLARYMRKQGPALSQSADLEALNREPLVSIVMSRCEDHFQDYGSFEDWPHAEPPLGLNPLYRAELAADRRQLRLRRVFPSSFYEADHAECKQYLPDDLVTRSAVLDDLRRGRRTDEIEGLLERCVVLGIPPRYLDAHSTPA